MWFYDSSDSSMGWRQSEGMVKVMCIALKKVDSQTRVNNVQFTHRKAAQIL